MSGSCKKVTRISWLYTVHCVQYTDSDIMAIDCVHCVQYIDSDIMAISIHCTLCTVYLKAEEMTHEKLIEISRFWRTSCE